MLTIAGGIVLGVLLLIALAVIVPWIIQICVMMFVLVVEPFKKHRPLHAPKNADCPNPEGHNIMCNSTTCRRAWEERYPAATV